MRRIYGRPQSFFGIDGFAGRRGVVRAVDLGSIAVWPLPRARTNRRDRRRLSPAPDNTLPGWLDADDGGHDVADDPAAARDLPSLNGAASGSPPAFNPGDCGLSGSMDGVRYCRSRRRLVNA